MNDLWTWTSSPVGAWAENIPNFASQGDAEQWLGEMWQRMAEAGVAEVTLTHGAAVVYGPMSLQELE